MKGVATSGDRIGRYRLLQTLGEGGMGVVHLADDPEGRKVAIKVLRPAVSGDATALRRLAREVDSMRRVHSPHVAEILDADVTAEQPYIVTQYVPGRTLEEIVEDGGPIVGGALQRLAVGLASALSAIHGAGIIHRDLKPGNVMLVDGEPVVIDFGIAQGADATRLTATGMVIGTPGYLAPEIIEGEDAGMPSDVHSWAGTVTYGATGRPPFGSGSFESIFYKIMQGLPDLDGVPDALLPLINSAMARHPAERPTAVKLVQLSRRIHLEATITDQTRVDSPFRRPRATTPPPQPEPSRPERLDHAGEFYRSTATPASPPPAPEPVPAQPKDFKGLLPPAAPPPASTTFDQPRPYDPPATRDQPGSYGQPRAYDQAGSYEPSTAYDQPRPYDRPGSYDPPTTRDQAGSYEPPTTRDQAGSYDQRAYGQPVSYEPPTAYDQPRAYDQQAGPYDPAQYGPYNQPQVAEPRQSRRDRKRAERAQAQAQGQGQGLARQPYDPYAPQAGPGTAERRPATSTDKPPKPFGWYRFLSLLVLAALLGFCAAAPVLAVIVTLVGVLVMRIGDRAALRMESKRTRRGPRSGDVAAAMVKSPLGVPRAVLVTGLIAPLALSVGGALLVGLMLAKPDLTASRAISYAAMTIVVLLCLGPGSAGPRRQTARVWGALLPRREAAMPAALLFGIFAAVLIGLSVGQPPDTYPVNGMTEDLESLRNRIQDLPLIPGGS